MEGQYITLIPDRDIWPFVTRMRIVGVSSVNDRWVDKKMMPQCQCWCVEVDEDDMVCMYAFKKKLDGTQEVLMFYVIGLLTRSGVMLRKPEDILDFFR